MVEQLRKREEMPVNDTWDLSPVFSDDTAWEDAYQAAEARISELQAFKGNLAKDAATLTQAICTMFEIERQISRVYTYSHLKQDQDAGNSTYQSLEARATQLYIKFSEAFSFFGPELLAIPEETLNSFLAESADLASYRQFIDDQTRHRAHTLSSEEESLLAQAGEVFGGASNTFSLLNNADLVFPTIKDEEGKDVQLTHSLYGKFLESKDRRVRKDTFEAFYKVYDQFKNTFASTLSHNIKVHNYQAKVRKYPTARSAALANNNVPESVYDTLLETVGSRLSLLHRYVGLRKQLLDLDDLQMYDLYTPLLGKDPVKFTYEEAQAIVLEAVAPMGAEYVAIMKEAFADRWIDIYENKGKRSGAYSSGMYDTNPYILLNWQDNINWLYTLIHELGHSAHSYLTHKYQPYAYGSYSIFLAEIASTTNENLLTAYLLDKYEDPQIRLYILNHFLDGLKGTVFRQTQFAEFEHFMHVADAEGTPLTQEFLSQNYKQLNEKYYGPEVNSDSEIALEWARIPHFYYNYYVFQYATGFSAATFFADKIVKGDQAALDKYLGFLKSGCSEYPIDTMKRAGLDMTQSDYINATLDVFEQRLNEFESLLKTHA